MKTKNKAIMFLGLAALATLSTLLPFLSKAAVTAIYFFMAGARISPVQLVGTKTAEAALTLVGEITKFPSPEEDRNGFKPFTLTSAMHHCCSEPAFTFESNQGLCDHGNVIYDYDEIYDAHMLLFAETIRFALRKYNKM